jgi:hypothetical protein
MTFDFHDHMLVVTASKPRIEWSVPCVWKVVPQARREVSAFFRRMSCWLQSVESVQHVPCTSSDKIPWLHAAKAALAFDGYFLCCAWEL